MAEQDEETTVEQYLAAALTDLTFGELCSDDPTIKNYVELPTNRP